MYGYENGMRMLNLFLSPNTCKSFSFEKQALQTNFGPYVLSGGPLIFNVILFKRKAVYTEGAGPVCKCTGQCTLEGSILLF